MKLKLIVKLGELILGKAYSEDAPRADMYLPIWLLSFALVLFVGGIAVGIYAVIALSIAAAVAAAVCLILGILALLCWKNQSIRMLSDDSFEYTTFLGNKREYRFSDITGLKRSSDSMTLFVGSGKVHIETCAILTDKLVERIDRELDRIA